MTKKKDLMEDPVVAEAGRELYDRIATKASSAASVVLRFCTGCKTMKPKEGSRADDPKYICPACEEGTK